MKKHWALLTALMLACGSPYYYGNQMVAQTKAQTGTVTGSVVDDKGEPLIGAAVRVKGTKVGVNTDINGKFSIKASPNATLEISYVGCEPVTVKGLIR